MAKRLEIVQVVFNVDDPFQAQLYAHVVKHPNKSGFIKRIVQRDMDGVAFVAAPALTQVSTVTDVGFDANGFI